MAGRAITVAGGLAAGVLLVSVPASAEEFRADVGGRWRDLKRKG